MKHTKQLMNSDMPEAEELRERLLQYGTDSLSTIELLALIIHLDSSDESLLSLSKEILSQYNGLRGLAKIEALELMEFQNLGKLKAIQIAATLALGQRLQTEQPSKRPQINRAIDAAHLLMDMANLTHEQVRVMTTMTTTLTT